MERILYQQSVKDLRNNIYNVQLNEVESLGLMGTYMMVSANLFTYLPNLKTNNHFNTIQDIQFHRALSNIDQHYLSLLNDLKISDKDGVINKSISKSHIFVTYHTGSYRMFIQHLLKKNTPFCLVTEERFIKDQGTTVQKIVKQIRGNSDEELEILAAENPKLLFELIGRLRKGISVVFYIDGNTGATEKKLEENKNLLKINFLSHHIYARQGIALLAYLSKSPVATAIAKRSKNLSNRIYIKTVETEKLFQHNNRQDFVDKITRKLYRELERFLVKNPEQWEGWFYVDKFFQIEDYPTEVIQEDEFLNSAKPILLVLDDYIHLSKYDDENCFLINRKNYQIMKITDALYMILDFFKEPRQLMPGVKINTEAYEFSREFIMELIEMKLLKPTQ